jgi:hypothetical protein
MEKSERDAAVFVVDPGRVKIVERVASGNQSVREESRKEKDVFWQPAGIERDTINQGPSMYRQISVRSEVTRTAALRCLSPGRSNALIAESEWLGD